MVKTVEEVRQRFKFDADADMRWLALWAEHWDELPARQRIAIADSTGTIWGFAVPALEPRAVEVVARDWLFHGPSNHRKGVRS